MSLSKVDIITTRPWVGVSRLKAFYPPFFQVTPPLIIITLIKFITAARQ